MITFNDVKKFFSIKKYGKLKLGIWTIFYLGIITGCFCKFSFDFFNNIFFQKINFWNLELFNTIIFTEIFIILLLFLFSLTIFGTIISFILTFAKGLGIGIVIYFLYSKFLIKGIFFGILALLPGLFISSVALIFFAEESVKLSILITKKIFYKNKNWPCLNFKLHIKSFVKALIISGFGVFIHVFLAYIFLKLFNFFNIF